MNIGSGMLLDRTIQPKVRDIEHLAVQMPQRCTMPNGVSLNVLDSGDNEVVRIDLLMEGGRWQQSQPLQPGWSCPAHRNMRMLLFIR